MPDIYDIADQFRRQLLKLERQAASAMVRAYGQAWREIRVELSQLTKQIAATRASGQRLPPTWLYQEQRLKRLQLVVESQIAKYAAITAQSIATQQAAVVDLAQTHAQQLMVAGLGRAPRGVESPTVYGVPHETLVTLVGMLQDGSPLRDLLDQLGPQASARAEDALVAGVTTGAHPRQIASQMRKAMGLSLARSLTIARTETMRAYRETTHRTYQANNDLMEGWVWWCALDRRTCAACWAMHGTIHPLHERLDDHPSGRCSALPRMRSWEALGYQGVPDTRPPIVTGVETFARLSEAEQRAILGPGKLAAYQKGQLDLADVVGRHFDAKWGSHRYERSMRELRPYLRAP